MDLLDRSFRGEVFHSNELAELRRGTQTHFGEPNRNFARAVLALRDSGHPLADAQWAVGQATMKLQNGDEHELITLAIEALRREDLAA
jgi:hypothetical protein